MFDAPDDRCPTALLRAPPRFTASSTIEGIEAKTSRSLAQPVTLAVSFAIFHVHVRVRVCLDKSSRRYSLAVTDKRAGCIQALKYFAWGEPEGADGGQGAE
jgi:hypothetical protein